jgi:thioredoxin 1
MAHEFTEANFDQEVLQSPEPVLVDFWAPWCAPCRQMTPTIDALAREMTGVKIGKVNVDEAPGLASEYDVSSIPALLFFHNGRQVGKLVGIQSAGTIRQRLQSLKR